MATSVAIEIFSRPEGPKSISDKTFFEQMVATDFCLFRN